MNATLTLLRAWAPDKRMVRAFDECVRRSNAELMPLAHATGQAHLASTQQAQQQLPQPPGARPAAVPQASPAQPSAASSSPVHSRPAIQGPAAALQQPQPANPLAACEAPTQAQAAAAAPAAAAEAPAAAASPSAERCSLCGQAATAPVRCGRCGTTYCGRRCQVQHFREGHLKECTAIVKARVAARLAASPYGGSDSGSATAGGASGSS